MADEDHRPIFFPGPATDSRISQPNI